MKFTLPTIKLPDAINKQVKKVSEHTPRLLLLVLFIFMLIASWYRVFDSYEYQSYDWRFKFREHTTPLQDVLMIGIADADLEMIGRWPFSRDYHAILLDILKQYNAKMIGLDILFVESDPATDQAFAEAAQSNGRAYFCRAFGGLSSVKDQVVAQEILSPLLPILLQSARGVGHVNAIVDSDGKRRRIAPIIRYEEVATFHLGVAMAMEYLNIKPSEVAYRKGRWFLGDQRIIRVDENGHTLVRFHDQWTQAFNHVSYGQILASFRQVLSGEEPDWDLKQLSGKTCFLGLTATGTHDINPVPIDPLYAQVGIHADVFRNVIENQFIQRLHRGWNLIILILLLVGAGLLSGITILVRSISGAIAVVFGYILLSICLFRFGGVWIDLIYPITTFLVVYLMAILRRTMFEKKRREDIEKELSIASRIQRSFLPAKLPKSEHLDIATYMHPAKHVGGDLYDVVQIDEEHIGIMCGDVSGKGMPAALFMARAVAEFKFNVSSNVDPAVTLNGMNAGMAAVESSGLFVTVNYAIVNTSQRWINFSCGGAMPVLRISKDGTQEWVDPEGGMPIGLMEGVDFGCQTLPLKSGDIFVMYTDGISEARNKRREDYETERLSAVVKKYRDQTADTIKSEILKDVELFVQDEAQFDDMTLIITKVV